MQAKLKYKLYGEFSDYEFNELTEWFNTELKDIAPAVVGAKSLKITIDWEPASEEV